MCVCVSIHTHTQARTANVKALDSHSCLGQRLTDAAAAAGGDTSSFWLSAPPAERPPL